MTKKLLMTMVGLCVTTLAGAANDPDSLGRSAKYLDTLNSVVISYYTPNSQCFQYAPNVPPPVLPITCVSLTGTGSQTLPVTSVGDIVVGAGESRSLLTLNMTSVADYYLINTTGARTSASLNAQIKVTIESSVLSDPSLINPRTGLPFDGKIEMTYQWFLDSRFTEVNAYFQVATKMPFDVTILSRKMLTSMYGLSSTRAALLFSRPMTVKLSLSGSMAGAGRANFHMHGRLMGD